MMKNRKGVTLLEVLISIAIIGIALQLILSILISGNSTYDIVTKKGYAQQDIRMIGDYITSELKYVSIITNDVDTVQNEFTGNYYSLEVQNIGDSHILVNKFYKYVYNESDVPDDDYIVTEKTIAGKWDSFTISNTEPGILKVNIAKEEKEKKQLIRYELPLEILLINNIALESNIDIDLINGDVLYYKKANDELLNRGIDIPLNDDNDESEEDGQGDNQEEPSPITFISIVKIIEITKSGNEIIKNTITNFNLFDSDIPELELTKNQDYILNFTVYGFNLINANVEIVHTIIKDNKNKTEILIPTTVSNNSIKKVVEVEFKPNEKGSISIKFTKGDLLLSERTFNFKINN